MPYQITCENNPYGPPLYKSDDNNELDGYIFINLLLEVTYSHLSATVSQYMKYENKIHNTSYNYFAFIIK